MSLQVKENTRVRVQKVVEVKDNYTIVHLSSSDKRKNEDKYDYSNWSYARLVGKAHNEGVSEGDVLSLKSAKVSFVNYKKEDEWVSPKTPTLVVFDFDFYRAGASKPKEEIPVLPPDDDDIPF